MKGDLRYNCGGNVDLCMDKPVFKRKIYDEIYEMKLKEKLQIYMKKTL